MATEDITERINQYGIEVKTGDTSLTLLPLGYFPELSSLDDYLQLARRVGRRIGAITNPGGKVTIYQPKGPIQSVPYSQISEGLDFPEKLELGRRLFGK